MKKPNLKWVFWVLFEKTRKNPSRLGFFWRTRVFANPAYSANGDTLLTLATAVKARFWHVQTGYWSKTSTNSNVNSTNINVIKLVKNRVKYFFSIKMCLYCFWNELTKKRIEVRLVRIKQSIQLNSLVPNLWVNAGVKHFVNKYSINEPLLNLSEEGTTLKGQCF